MPSEFNVFKLVKLRKNQYLFKQGFTHAFRVVGWPPVAAEITFRLEKIYNNRRWRGKYWAWEVQSTLQERKANESIDIHQHFWYTYIAVRNEKVATQIMLML